MPKRFILIFVFALAGFGCQSNSGPQNAPDKTPVPKPTATAKAKEAPRMIDVVKLANKPAADLDAIFGPPEKITPATVASEKPGEYRLYKMSGHPKGLSVRFYKDKAVRFNLLLGTPEKNAREALSKLFGIDVSKMSPVKSESLSETWKGSLGGVNFATAYAKRDNPGGDFVMVHAEIGQ